MSKLTKILAGVTLTLLCGAWGGATAYADLKYHLIPMNAATDLGHMGLVWQDFMLMVNDRDAQTATFFNGSGQLSATGFTGDPYWSFYNFYLFPPFSKSTGSIIPPNRWFPDSDTVSSDFQNGQFLQFHAPDGGEGSGLEIGPGWGLELGYFSLIYAATSAPPNLEFIPNSYANEAVSHVWTETTGSTTVNLTDKNGGKVRFEVLLGIDQRQYVGDGVTMNVDTTMLNTLSSHMVSFQIHPTGKVIWTEDPSAPRQSAAVVNSMDGGRLLLFGKFDITNHDLILFNTKMEDVQYWITSGKLITSKAGTTIGYARASDLGLSTFDTLDVNSADILIKDTYAGDANLDGMLTGVDFAQIDAAFLSGLYTSEGAEWIHGDCNYDGKITLADFALMDAAFTIYYRTNGQMALARAQADAARFGSEFTALYDAALASAVPEPASLGVLLLGGGGLMIRRRRRRAA